MAQPDAHLARGDVVRDTTLPAGDSCADGGHPAGAYRPDTGERPRPRGAAPLPDGAVGWEWELE
jgi:hypothetical protein